MKHKPKTRKVTISSATFSEWVQLSDRRLRQVAAMGYFSAPVGGKYLLNESVRGMFRYLNERLKSHTGQMAEVRLAREQERLKREKIETGRVAGEIVDKADVKRDISRHVLSAKTRLLAIPSSAAPVLAGLMNPVEIEDKLRRFIFDAIDELAGIVK